MTTVGSGLWRPWYNMHSWTAGQSIEIRRNKMDPGLFGNEIGSEGYLIHISVPLQHCRFPMLQLFQMCQRVT